MKIFRQNFNKIDNGAYDFVGIHLSEREALRIRLLSLCNARTVSKFISDTLIKLYSDVDMDNLILLLSKKAYIQWSFHIGEISEEDFKSQITKELKAKRIPREFIADVVKHFDKLKEDEENKSKHPDKKKDSKEI